MDDGRADDWRCRLNHHSVASRAQRDQRTTGRVTSGTWLSRTAPGAVASLGLAEQPSSMEATTESAVAESYRESGAIRGVPGPRQLAAVVAVLVGYGMLTIANRFFDPGGGPPGELTSRATIAAIEALLWIIVTPILFAVAARIDLDASRASRRRGVGLLVLVLSTVAAAALLAFIGLKLRSHFTPFQFGRRGRGGRGGPPGGLIFWFGFVKP